ncbi:MAG: HAD hydrolase-like protein [Burkholderiaceae bacterium]
MAISGSKPSWLTFDCYGTLIQWDEGLLQAVQSILANLGSRSIDPAELIEIYDRHEHALEQTPPHRPFRVVAGQALALAMRDLNLPYQPSDIEVLTSGISAMPPFKEVPEALGALKRLGYKLAVISNTDDDIISGNVAQLGGHIDRVITAEQAGAYKPARQVFDFAHAALGVSQADLLHVCASPHLDLAAAREMRFRCIWVNRGTKREPLPDYTPDVEVSDLGAVVGILSECQFAQD